MCRCDEENERARLDQVAEEHLRLGHTLVLRVPALLVIGLITLVTLLIVGVV